MINAEHKFSNILSFLVYKVDEHSPLIHEIYGYWSAERGLTDLRETRILSRRRRNLREKVLKSTLILTRNDTHKYLDDLK